ncbi:MAG: hypothetical protein ACI4SX_03065, partial [Candidatus Fimenecus sp.]
VVLMLVFSCVPAYAESQIIEGYAVDNVPYNEAFEGVLTASDNGSQLYSSSENRTYKTSSVLSAPATSSSSLYSSKSITNMRPINYWRGGNNPTITSVSDNGYNGIKYVWASNASPNTVNHLNSVPVFNFFKSERKYRFTFTLNIKSYYKGNFEFYLASPSSPSEPVVTLCSISAPSGSPSFLSHSQSYSLDVSLPNGVTSLIPIIKASVYGNDFILYINDFTVTDITTEDLDNSIDKGVQKIENAGSDEPPLDTDISAFQSAIDTMNGWLEQLDEFADSIDSAGETASEYISKGTELFNGFMGIAPASVIALVAFGVVFLVIRKIVGR